MGVLRSQAAAPLALSPAKTGRVLWIDAARGLAIIAMVVYHLAFDLVLFGFVDWPVAEHWGWRAFAAAIASTFLFLAGVSLVLAHGEGVHWRAYLRRLAMLAAAASAVTLATLIAMPQAPVYFGILHAIATFSILALPLVQSPAALALLAAIAVAVAHHARLLPDVGLPLGYPLGLLPAAPTTVDYEPVFPWLCATLLGVAFARSAWFQTTGPGARPGGLPLGLSRIGRHSLLIYLVHQPVLFACLFALQAIVPR